jgi:hypothetical protein
VNPQEKPSALDIILFLAAAGGLAAAVAVTTFFMLREQGITALIIGMLVNLVLAYIIMVAILIMGESIIEDGVKAVLFSLIMIPLWFSKYSSIPYVRCTALCIVFAAWYPLGLRVLLPMGKKTDD